MYKKPEAQTDVRELTLGTSRDILDLLDSAEAGTEIKNSNNDMTISVCWLAGLEVALLTGDGRPTELFRLEYHDFCCAGPDLTATVTHY